MVRPAHRAGEIVGQIQIGDGAAHRDRPLVRNHVQQMPGALEEQIRLVRDCALRKLRSSSWACFWPRSLRFPMVMCSMEPVFASSDQKERHMLDGQRVDQPVRHRAQHLVQIGFRTQFAREFDQRPPVVVAVLVEEVAVQLFLQPVANRLEDERREQDQAHDGRRAQIFRAERTKRSGRRRCPAPPASPACTRSLAGR